MTVYAVRTAVHNIFTYLQKSTGMLKQYSYEMMLTHSSVNENWTEDSTYLQLWPLCVIT